MRRNEREIKDKTEIEAIIKKSDVCRIALIDGDIPYIVALNFGYKAGDKSILYFHCANTGRKLDIIKKKNIASFQMDVDHELILGSKACACTMKYKSIVGYGKIYITNKQEKIEGLNYIMKQYTDENSFKYEEKMLDVTTVLKLEIEEISAKQIV